MAAKLLKAANSALYGGLSAVETCPAAVVRLGMGTTRHLVLSFALKDVFKSDEPMIQERMRVLWKHSAQIAAICFVLAREIEGMQPEEALLIEVKPPECEAWNFQLDNHWMESLDYRYFRVTINKHTATYEPDGSLKLIVAHEDPGHANWIETTGHQQGTMCFRWIRADEHPQPRCRVVKFTRPWKEKSLMPPNGPPRVKTSSAGFMKSPNMSLCPARINPGPPLR